LTKRTFKLLDKNGTRIQFGGTPEIGCRDGIFTLKALLNAHRNHNLASYIGFADLVKSYNNAHHALLLCNLESYRAPPKFDATIDPIYTDNIFVLKIEKEIKVETPQSIVILQGDNMDQSYSCSS